MGQNELPRTQEDELEGKVLVLLVCS